MTYDGFTHASKDRDFAERVASKGVAGKILIVIESPQGRDVAPWSAYPDEAEVAFELGVKFRVKTMEDRGRHAHHHPDRHQGGLNMDKYGYTITKQGREADGRAWADYTYTIGGEQAGEVSNPAQCAAPDLGKHRDHQELVKDDVDIPRAARGHDPGGARGTRPPRQRLHPPPPRPQGLPVGVTLTDTKED